MVLRLQALSYQHESHSAYAVTKEHPGSLLQPYNTATVKIQSGQSILLFICNYSDVHLKILPPIQ
jgi:hypothetical protein